MKAVTKNIYPLFLSAVAVLVIGLPKGDITPVQDLTARAEVLGHECQAAVSQLDAVAAGELSASSFDVEQLPALISEATEIVDVIALNHSGSRSEEIVHANTLATTCIALAEIKIQSL